MKAHYMKHEMVIYTAMNATMRTIKEKMKYIAMNGRQETHLCGFLIHRRDGTMKAAYAFWKGYKPAFFEIPDSPFCTPQLPYLIENFPYIDEKKCNLFDGKKFYIFFQEEESMLNFQRQMEAIQPQSPEFHKIFGLTLGFPPNAVDFYVKKITAKEDERLQLKRQQIGLRFCGISCAANINDLIEDALWLWDRYPYPEAIREGLSIRVHNERVSVPYKNFTRLRYIHMQILERTHSINSLKNASLTP